MKNITKITIVFIWFSIFFLVAIGLHNPSLLETGINANDYADTLNYINKLLLAFPVTSIALFVGLLHFLKRSPSMS